jgi:cholestenol Delta-isomerase
MVRHPLRHPLQAVVSVAHVYGSLLYYATSTFAHFYGGISYSRPEALYFWGYYVFANLPWIVIPLCKSPYPQTRYSVLTVGLRSSI